MELLGTKLFGDFTVLQVGGAAVVLIVLVMVVRSFMSKKEPAPSYMEEASCQSCGWHGTVSRYNRVCRGCNAKL